MKNPADCAPVTLASVLERIRAYTRARAWTPGQLAGKAGLSRGTLGRLFEADFLPSSTTIFAIERVIPGDWRPGAPVSDEPPPAPDEPVASAEASQGLGSGGVATS